MTQMSSTDMRDAFWLSLYDVAKTDKRIIVLSNDFGAPALDRFRADLPDQFINAMIAEQNLIGTAAGLAATGFKPIVYSIASFVTLRCLEQIKLDLCVMKLPVTILGVGPCYAYSADGPTHHASEDVALFRPLANMEIYSPSEPAQCELLAADIPNTTLPRYIRADRGKYPIMTPAVASLSDGFRTLGTGKDGTIVATGLMVHRAIEVAEALGEAGCDIGVVDLFRLKPVDEKALLSSLNSAPRLITLEEHSLQGGLGSMMAEMLADTGTCKPLLRCGLTDEKIYAYGTRDQLHMESGLDKVSLQKNILTFCKQ